MVRLVSTLTINNSPVCSHINKPQSAGWNKVPPESTEIILKVIETNLVNMALLG